MTGIHLLAKAIRFLPPCDIKIISEKPGAYSPTDVIRELRISYIMNGLDDPRISFSKKND